MERNLKTKQNGENKKNRNSEWRSSPKSPEFSPHNPLEKPVLIVKGNQMIEKRVLLTWDKDSVACLWIMNTTYCEPGTKKILQIKDSHQNFRTHSYIALCRFLQRDEDLPPTPNKYINKALRTLWHLPRLHPCAQSPTVSVELPPSCTCHLEQASNIPRLPFCFTESPSSFKSCRDPTACPGPRRKVCGTSPPISALPSRYAISFKQL